VARRHRPPRLARWLIRHALPSDARECVVGDLDEEYARHRAPAGRASAWFWYWSQALRSVLQTSPQEITMGDCRPSFRTRGAAALSAMPHDLRFAVRTLRRAPGYAAAALLTFAVGVGAAIAIFSAVNAILLRPLPYAAPD